MKTTIKLLPMAARSLVSLGLILATVFGIGMAVRPKETPQRPDEAPPVISVEVVPLVRHTDGIDFRVDGEVVPFRSLNVVPEVQGRVVFKSEQCRMGKAVKAGDVLLEIDQADYRLEVDRLTEAVAQAAADIAENRVQLENMQKELEIAREQLAIRERELTRYENSKVPGAYSSAELDTVRTSLLGTRDTVQKLENQHRLYETQAARLESAHRKEKVNLAQAELDLSRTKVKAPISGILTTDSFEVNSYVQKGESVAVLLDTSILEIHSKLHMKQVQWILRSENMPRAGEDDDLFDGYRFPSTAVTVQYELEGEAWQWTGTLQALNGGGVDAATRMVPCRVTVDQPRAVRRGTQVDSATVSAAPPTLLSGMYVSIVVHAKPNVPLYRIPEKALLPGNRIWTATNGKLHQHAIRVATTTPEGVLFYAESDRLQPVDLVVVSPMATPIEGGNVQIANPPSGIVNPSVAKHLRGLTPPAL